MTGKQLRALRLRLGLTQAALARKLGVSVGIVHVWERRLQIPPSRIPYLVKLEKKP